MASGQGTLVNIQDYKCVPLDLLRNVQEDSSGLAVVGYNVTSEDVTLTDFKKAAKEEIQAEGSFSNAMSADKIENFVVGVSVAFAILIFLSILFYTGIKFYLNRKSGALSSVPYEIRTMPVVLLVSLIVGVLGFLAGYFLA